MNRLTNIDSSENGAAPTVVIARFSNADEAAGARDTLSELFNRLNLETSELFVKQGGCADASDIARIYERSGLQNEIGWEQLFPILVSGPDIAWALPIGARKEDAENLLWNLGAHDVAVHEQTPSNEDWRMAPNPMGGPSVSIDEGAFIPEELPLAVSSRKRTLH